MCLPFSLLLSIPKELRHPKSEYRSCYCSFYTSITNKNNNMHHDKDGLCYTGIHIDEQATFYVCCAETVNWTVTRTSDDAMVKLAEMVRTLPVYLAESASTTFRSRLH